MRTAKGRRGSGDAKLRKKVSGESTSSGVDDFPLKLSESVQKWIVDALVGFVTAIVDALMGFYGFFL